jgi:PAS domain S-box-containing protein
MNLRSKTLIILCLTLLLAIALILTLSYTVLIGSYSDFEQTSVRDSIRHAEKAIQYEISLIESKCGEWSRWDDTYRYVHGEYPEYIEKNLNPESFDNLGLDFLVFLNQSRNVVYVTGYNTTLHKQYQMNSSEISQILSTPYLFSQEQVSDSRSGIISLNRNPVLIVSQPILKSTYEGPPAGFLIVGKYIDSQEIKKISDVTSLSLSVIPVEFVNSDINLPPSQDDIQKKITEPPIFINTTSSDVISGYSPLYDVTGNNSYYLRVAETRELYHQGLVTIGSFIAIIIIIGIVLVLSTLFIIDVLVLKRLAILIDRARTRNAMQNNVDDPLLKSEDELSELAQALNPVFDDIIRSERQLQESEDRYRNVVESQTEFICRFTPEGRHIFANSAYCTYFGKTQDELLQGTFMAQTVPEDVKMVRDHFHSLTPSHPVATIEHRVIMPSGDVRWHQWTDLAIFTSDGTVTEYQSVGRDITERIQHQKDLLLINQELTNTLERLTQSEDSLKEALRISEENERKYHELADSLPEFVFEVDTTGKLTFLNRLGLEVAGYQSADLEKGLYAVNLVVPEDRIRLAENMQAILAGERISGQEYLGYRKDGSHFPIVIYSIRVLRDNSVIGLRGFAIDITEKKRMEASNQKLADIVQHTQAGIVTGTDEEIDVINPAFALMHGYTSEEILDISIFSLFSQDLQKDFPGYLKKAKMQGHFVFEADHIRGDGSVFPTLNDLTVIHDDEGQVKYWILNVQDITEHRLAWKILIETESLRESHRQLSDVISRLPDATFVVDQDGWVIFWNAAMEQLTGIHSADIIGRGKYEYAIPLYGYKRPLLLDIVLNPALDPEEYYSDLTRSGSTLQAEVYLPDTVHGPMHLSSVASPLFDAKGRVIGAIESIRDISSRKRVEQALLKTNEKLNLLSSITRHDIRNRITVLFGILPIVKRMSSSPEMAELIDLLEKAAYAIRDQIEFTRDYQDMGVHAPEWRDAGELLDHISHQGLLSAVRLENELHGLMIYADPLLERVFYNLVDNAIRHGGDITLIAASYVPNQGGIVVIFEDNGAGIPDELKTKVFERGYGKNTGLGLFLVREILSITGISIVERGIFGSGARFEILVPEGCYRFS